MVTISPRFITVHEADVASVVSYNVQVREADLTTVLAAKNQEADPSGDTVIQLGDIVTSDLLGQTISLFLQEVGPTGALSEFQGCGDATEHGTFVVREIPDGAESAIVTV